MYFFLSFIFLIEVLNHKNCSVPSRYLFELDFSFQRGFQHVLANTSENAGTSTQITFSKF